MIALRQMADASSAILTFPVTAEVLPSARCSCKCVCASGDVQASPDPCPSVLAVLPLCQPNNMFELMAHAAHMKAHFTSLVPEESRHEYVQEHKMGFCTQFKHCETNPFYPDVVQADGNAGWYSTDQSGWIGQSDDPAGAIGSGGEWVNGELPASGSGTYEYNWGSFVYPTARGNGGLGGGGHPMGMLLGVSEARSVLCVIRHRPCDRPQHRAFLY